MPRRAWLLTFKDPTKAEIVVEGWDHKGICTYLEVFPSYAIVRKYSAQGWIDEKIFEDILDVIPI